MGKTINGAALRKYFVENGSVGRIEYRNKIAMGRIRNARYPNQIIKALRILEAIHFGGDKPKGALAGSDIIVIIRNELRLHSSGMQNSVGHAIARLSVITPFFMKVAIELSLEKADLEQIIGKYSSKDTDPAKFLLGLARDKLSRYRV